MAKIYNIEELQVYQKLCNLHIEIHELSLTWPKFELYELGSQIRRSSNSSPAILAEVWNNKHPKIFLEGISRTLGEIGETKHHLRMAFRKKYISKTQFESFINRCDECSKMLRGLEKSEMARLID